MEDKKAAVANKKDGNKEIREPDCVTAFRRGNTVLVVKGYFNRNTSETAEDKMERALKLEAETMQAV